MTTSPDPTCKDLIETLDDYIELRLPEQLRAAFDKHLSICPSCRSYLTGYQQTIALTKQSASHLPPPMPEELRAALAEIARSTSRLM
jgi:hypothetical protein